MSLPESPSNFGRLNAMPYIVFPKRQLPDYDPSQSCKGSLKYRRRILIRDLRLFSQVLWCYTLLISYPSILKFRPMNQLLLQVF